MKRLNHSVPLAVTRVMTVMVGPEDWRMVIGDCAGCPRIKVKDPLLVNRDQGSLQKVRFVIIAQEPEFALRGKVAESEKALIALCKGGQAGPAAKSGWAHPAVKMVQVFGGFDPAKDDIYLTHALKCSPSTSDRDITKEWRKAGKACSEHLRGELERFGQEEINVLAIGKYATELCLFLFDGQDIDPDLSISEVMQSNRMPLVYQVKWKSGRSQRFNLFLFTNPGKDVCTVQRKGGKMTVDEIQALEGEMLRGLRKGNGKGNG